MKMLINKLFEWLGYVPKGNETDYVIARRVDWLHDAVFSNLLGNYCVTEVGDAYLISLFEEYNSTHFPIKLIPYGDDKEYAKLCAEELCEMLNQKI